MYIKDVRIYFGKEEIESVPSRIYDEKIISFLDDWSSVIRHDPEARKYSDIQTFGFWIRNANITQFKQSFAERNEGITRFGRGLAFHIAPSNIPINFAYTWVFGLLSGNSNIVKVSSKDFEQTRILCRIGNELVNMNSGYADILKRNMVIAYDREREDITKQILSECDVKVIWGGDATIEKLRSLGAKPRCVEVTFADRYSFAVIDTKSVVNAELSELRNLAHRFYNDTYLIDQNACSSPNLIFWLGEYTDDAKERFYQIVKEEEGNYDLSDIKVSDKYVHACENACKYDVSICRYGNFIYDYELKSPDKDITKYRGSCGEFFSININDLKDIADYIDDERIQTCLVYGVDRRDILDIIMENGIKGIDRIVEFGQALELGSLWDGYDIIGEMSRVITV